MLRVELLEFPPTPKYAKAQIPNLPSDLYGYLDITAADHAVQVVRTTQYQGESDWLMLYGPGGLDRRAPMIAQRLKGGHVICWDAPYWRRGEKLRVSIDHAHPQRWVMRRQWPDDRIISDGMNPVLPRVSYWRPTGPILVAGIGPKAKLQYGAAVVDEWERKIVTACHRRWPDRAIWYRPKPPHRASLLPYTQGAPAGPIDDVLMGCSLVVTWHSNVAVDAIRRGIPVICRDGAAAAVCPPTLIERHDPLDQALRRKFLSNLAYFQWAPHEANMIWRFLREMLGRD